MNRYASTRRQLFRSCLITPFRQNTALKTLCDWQVLQGANNRSPPRSNVDKASCMTGMQFTSRKLHRKQYDSGGTNDGLLGHTPMFCSVMDIGSDIPPVFLNLNRATVFLPVLFMILPMYEDKQR